MHLLFIKHFNIAIYLFFLEFRIIFFLQTDVPIYYSLKFIVVIYIIQGPQ